MKHMTLKLKSELLEIFDNEENAFEWLFTKVPAFGYKTPIETIAKGNVEEVLILLHRTKHGVY